MEWNCNLNSCICKNNFLSRPTKVFPSQIPLCTCLPFEVQYFQRSDALDSQGLELCREQWIFVDHCEM